MQTQIIAELTRIEREQDLRVVLAVESGSRAWGFASPDSDWDVRFVYLRPLPWYVSIQRRRDVVAPPIDGELDVVGWDLPKALALLRKGNPPLLEWLGNPAPYRDSVVADRLRWLVRDHFRPVVSQHHYLSMARNNRRELIGDAAEVRLKKYFYVLRPVLACDWIARHDAPPPLPFDDLLAEAALTPSLSRCIDDLLAEKRASAELGRGPRIPELDAYLDARLSQLEAALKTARPAATPPAEPFDAVLHAALGLSPR